MVACKRGCAGLKYTQSCFFCIRPFRTNSVAVTISYFIASLNVKCLNYWYRCITQFVLLQGIYPTPSLVQFLRPCYLCARRQTEHLCSMARWLHVKSGCVRSTCTWTFNTSGEAYMHVHSFISKNRRRLRSELRLLTSDAKYFLWFLRKCSGSVTDIVEELRLVYIVYLTHVRGCKASVLHFALFYWNHSCCLTNVRRGYYCTVSSGFSEYR